MTLRELWLEFDVANERSARELEMATAVGYQAIKCWIKAQTRKGGLKLPSFESLLPASAKAAPKRQTPKQMDAALAIISKQFGLQMTREGAQ